MPKPSTIDVVTTATLRPELLALTLKSFTSKLLSQFDHRRIIINIDPLGNGYSKPDEILTLCNRYFNDVIYRVPEQPSFPAAVKWGWEQVNSPFFLHLEDDWLLRKEVDVDKAASYFEQDADLASITLNVSLNREHIYCSGLPLRPTLISKKYIDKALPLFDLAQDPEKQWKAHTALGQPLPQWRYRNYGEYSDGRFVIEMGASWRKAHQFDKWGLGETSWKNKGNKKSLRHLGDTLKYRTKYWLWSLLASI